MKPTATTFPDCSMQFGTRLSELKVDTYMKNLQRYMNYLLKGLLAAVILVPMQNTLAHGFLDGELPSRARQCQLKLNKDCENPGYEPQSTGEGPKGFFEGSSGPADGHLASGGIPLFSSLDAQSAIRWHKTEIKDLNVKFLWTYTAPHPIRDHNYYITKNGWDVNQPLSRASFDRTPFCKIPGGNAMPVPGTTHACVIPQGKQGYHVIVGEWNVNDTPAAFYDPVDVDIRTTPGVPGWNAVGTITPSATLQPGDSVKARAFTADGESSTYSVETSIDNTQEGMPPEWSYKLAKKISDTQSLIKAGNRGENDVITPGKGSNNIYAKPESGVTHYEVQLKTKEDADARMALSAIPEKNELVNGEATIRFGVMANREMNVEANLLNSTNESVGTVNAHVKDHSSWLEMKVHSKPGQHTMTLIGTTLDGRTTRQDTQPVTLTGEGSGQKYDHVFPEGLTSYGEGTRVLQPKTGLVYECKKFPYSGFCKQYTPTSNGYEPGVGAHWNDAWTQP
jgi:chitin-binding protein